MAAMARNFSDKNSVASGNSLPPTTDRRTAPRFSLDESVRIHPVSGATSLQGRMRDLSVGGCRLEIDTRLLTGAMLRIELQFQIRGIAFRLAGVTAGKRTKNSLGVRFVDLNLRRREDLAEVLAYLSSAEHTESRDPSAKPPQTIPVSKPALQSVAVDVRIRPDAKPGKPIPRPHDKASAAAQSLVDAEQPGVHIDVSLAQRAADAAPASRERRAHQRLKVDTRAQLYLVNTAIRMEGSIQDLSMAGCRIVTQERFNVGIYVRAEAEFYLHGLPFRLAGVSQAIINPNTIGLRFIDMSERKREQLAALIAEIREALAEKTQS